MTERTEVTFVSGGVQCAAHLYLPVPANGKVPCVVMVHGFTGTRNLGLPAYAERFAAAGMAVLVFDYAYFGASGGQPRQLLDIGRQLDDYRAAIAFARAQPGIDPGRIALWGTSLSGGHVIVVAAGDPRIAAVVSQVPFPGVEFGRPSERSAKVTLRLLAVAADDAVRGWLRRPPRLVPVFGKPGDMAIFTNPHDKAIIDALAVQAPEWRNAVAARMLFPLMRYQPRAAASQLAMPLLICVAEKETAASPALTADMASRAPKAQMRRYPIGHFDAYSGEWLERSPTIRSLSCRLTSASRPRSNRRLPARKPPIGEKSSKIIGWHGARNRSKAKATRSSTSPCNSWLTARGQARFAVPSGYGASQSHTMGWGFREGSMILLGLHWPVVAMQAVLQTGDVRDVWVGVWPCHRRPGLGSMGMRVLCGEEEPGAQCGAEAAECGAAP